MDVGLSGAPSPEITRYRPSYGLLLATWTPMHSKRPDPPLTFLVVNTGRFLLTGATRPPATSLCFGDFWLWLLMSGGPSTVRNGGGSAAYPASPAWCRGLRLSSWRSISVEICTSKVAPDATGRGQAFACTSAIPPST